MSLSSGVFVTWLWEMGQQPGQTVPPSPSGQPCQHAHQDTASVQGHFPNGTRLGSAPFTKRNCGHNLPDRRRALTLPKGTAPHRTHSNSKSTTFSDSTPDSTGGCLPVTPLFAHRTCSSLWCSYLLPTFLKAHRRHQLESSGVLGSGARIWGQETQGRSADLSNARQLPQGRARPHALSAQCHSSLSLVCPLTSPLLDLVSAAASSVAEVPASACFLLAVAPLLRGELDRFDLNLQPVEGRSPTHGFYGFLGLRLSGSLLLGPLLQADRLCWTQCGSDMKGSFAGLHTHTHTHTHTHNHSL